MRKVIAVVGVFAGLAVGSARADWVSTSYQTTLTRNSTYCDSFRNFEKLIGYLKDADALSAQGMVDKGVCRVTSNPIRIKVFQDRHIDDKLVIHFVAPSGKKFVTYKGFTE